MQPFLRLNFVTPVRQERSRWFFVEKPDFEAVPGTEIHFGASSGLRPSLSLMLPRGRVKDLPAFAKVMDVADSALDGKIL